MQKPSQSYRCFWVIGRFLFVRPMHKCGRSQGNKNDDVKVQVLHIIKICSRGGNRTRTLRSEKGILSPSCLPISPPDQIPPIGLEPITYALEVHCSILLSYGGIYVTRSTESLNGHRRLSCHKFFSNFYEIPPFCSLSKTLNNTAHKQSFLKRTFRLLSAS